MMSWYRCALLFASLSISGAPFAKAQQKAIGITPPSPTLVPGQTIALQVNSTEECLRGVKWTANDHDPAHTVASDGTLRMSTPYAVEYTAPKAADVAPNPPTVKAKCFDHESLQASVPVIINVASCSASGHSPGCSRLTPDTVVLKIAKPGHPARQQTMRFTQTPPGGRPVRWTINKRGQGNAVTGKLEDKEDYDTNIYTAPQTIPAEQVEIEVNYDPKTQTSQASSTVVLIADHVFIHCVQGGADCSIVDFDRLNGERGTIGGKDVTDTTDAAWVNAINASKALKTGSIVDFALPEGATPANCANYDWKFVTQAMESPNILVYNPSDVGTGTCYGNHYVIALPVRVLWIDVTGFGQLSDPERSAPGSLTGFKDCFGNNAPQTISPCDRDIWPMRWLYPLSGIYTHFGQAGTGQGTISLPTLVGQGARQLNWDVQADPALKEGLGWINVPIVFEKNTSAGSNLNSLSIALAYDLHFVREPNLTNANRFSSFVVRKPQFRVQSGTEIAPTTPHDVNWIESATLKLPFAFTLHKQPSALTIYPVMGFEGGAHVETHLPEPSAPLRGLAGGDASIRFPFAWTHNLLGGTPITLDYTYRERWLVHDEPTTNVTANLAETLAAGTHIFSRSTISVPFTPNLQFQLTYLRGGLPPSFAMLGNTVSVGITFTNPGSSEH